MLLRNVCAEARPVNSEKATAPLAYYSFDTFPQESVEKPVEKLLLDVTSS
jgi:hypothetical protein